MWSESKEIVVSENILVQAKAVVTGDHFVYKKGTHGKVYLNKEKFLELGGRALDKLLQSVGQNAVNNGIEFGNAKEVGVIGPAYGASSYPIPIAKILEKNFPHIRFFPARTEIERDANGKRFHVIPEKLKDAYRGKIFVIIEDIINNGTTIHEIKKLFSKEVNGNVVAVLCIADRGGQTANSLCIKQYFPFVDAKQDQFHAHDCPECKAGKKINTELGKGSYWVERYGQPPYEEDVDLSLF